MRSLDGDSGNQDSSTNLNVLKKSSLVYKSDMLALQKSSENPSKNLLFESSSHAVQEKELGHSLSLPAGSGQSPLAEADNHEIQLSSNNTVDECEGALLKEQKQSELPSSDEKVHVIDDKSWKTLSDEEDGAGSSSADEGLDKDSKKSLDVQKAEHKTLKKMKSQT